MIIRLFILASLILLSLLTTQAFSQTSSQPISGYDEVSGYFITGGKSLSEEAQASRAAQNEHPVKDTDIQTTSIGTQYFGPMNPQQSSRIQNLTTAVKPIVNITSSAEISSTRTVKVSGNWSLRLDDNASRKASLTLFQNGNVVYGTGKIRQSTNELQAVASGTITGSKLDLNLVSLGKVRLYRFYLTISKDSVAGSYIVLTPRAASKFTGTANGERSVTPPKR